jgi:hypothetical protein
MHKRTAGFILTGILAAGAAGAVAITPASATTSDNAITSRLAGIKTALSGLVKDGTLTQSQADKVASTLDSKLPKRGPGGPGRHLGPMGLGQTREAAAKALGMTTEKLETALRSGKSLADIAKDQKVSVDTLVKAMVTAAEDKLAAAVKAGTITQQRADTIKSSLTKRITDRVNGVRPERGPGHRPGHGFGHRPGNGPGNGSSDGPGDGTRGSETSPSSGDTFESTPNEASITV